MAKTKPGSEAVRFELDGEGPVYHQIERAIRANIQSGAWGPGFKIPSELELMRLAECSRATMNKALTNLANAGLIVRRRRSGSIVRESTEGHAVIGILDIRKDIESAGRRYSYRVTSKRILPDGTANGEWPEARGGEPLLALEALHCGDGLAEVIEERLIRLALVPEAAEEDFEDNPPSSWLLARLPCTRLSQVIKARAAGAKEARLLRIRKGDPLLIAERRTWSESEPVTWLRLTFAGARNEFVGEFNPLDPRPMGGDRVPT
ncbi:GntR family transcriptional regulator [Inquilinus limosus]|uniref:UTRA domain-containing protein n=1 Tax=Inquilinus limosus TaxID=171674 RepID=UPI003F1689C2